MAPAGGLASPGGPTEPATAAAAAAATADGARAPDADPPAGISSLEEAAAALRIMSLRFMALEPNADSIDSMPAMPA